MKTMNIAEAIVHLGEKLEKGETHKIKPKDLIKWLRELTEARAAVSSMFAKQTANEKQIEYLKKRVADLELEIYNLTPAMSPEEPKSEEATDVEEVVVQD